VCKEWARSEMCDTHLLTSAEVADIARIVQKVRPKSGEASSCGKAGRLLACVLLAAIPLNSTGSKQHTLVRLVSCAKRSRQERKKSCVATTADASKHEHKPTHTQTSPKEQQALYVRPILLLCRWIFL
jgi:hypothetical protein